MRLISFPLQQKLLAPARHHVPRLEVQDAADVWRDLSPWFRSFSWSEDRDASGQSGVLKLRREAMVDGVLHSLAPLVVSPLNETDGAFDPRLNPFRRVRLDVATVLSGTTPIDEEYFRVFDGIIDDPSWGGRESVIELAVRDLAGSLQDAIFETETVVGSADGLPILDALQAILDAAGFPDVTVNVDGDTAGWSVTPYIIPRGTSVWEACRTLALSIGWDFRYIWNDGDESFVPMLIEPPRTTGTAQLVLNGAWIRDLPRLRLNGTEVRNFGEVVFTNTTGDGPNRAIYTDTGSVDAYGRRAFGLDERNNPNINSYATALQYITAAVLDMATPYVEQDAVLPLLWHLQLGDVLEFPATPAPLVLYDTAQRFGVVGYRHELASDGSGTTTVTLRGRPIGAYQRWLALLRQKAITEGRSGGPGAALGPLLGDGSAMGGATGDGGVWLRIGFEAGTAAVEAYTNTASTTPVPAPALNANNLAAIVRRQEGATAGHEAFSTLKFFATTPDWYKLAYVRAFGFDRTEGFPATFTAQAINGFSATLGAITSLTVVRQGEANVLEWTAAACTSPHDVELLVWRNGEVVTRLGWAASGTWIDDGLPTNRDYTYALQAFTHDGVAFARSGPRATTRRPSEEDEPPPLPPPEAPGDPTPPPDPEDPPPTPAIPPVWLDNTPITTRVGNIPAMTQVTVRCDDPLCASIDVEAFDGTSWFLMYSFAPYTPEAEATATFAAEPTASAFRVVSRDADGEIREYSATRWRRYLNAGGG